MKHQPTHPTPAQKEMLINLWRYCFQDTEDFVQWYFNEYYQPEHTYILTEPQQGQIAAAMQCNPYTIHLRGQNVPATYLVGICTHPAYRGDGYFRALLPAVLQQLSAGQADIAFLQPIDNRLYRPYDFTYTHYRQDYTLSPIDIRDFVREHYQPYPESSISLLSQPAHYWQVFQEIYLAYNKKFHGYTCRTEQQWQNIFADWAMEHCRFALFYEGNEAVAYLVYRLREDTFEILETAYKTQPAYGQIWHYVYQHRTQAGKICWSAPQEDRLLEEIPHWQGKTVLHPHIMTRILSVERLLSALSYPPACTGAICLAVQDEMIPENNGIFSLAVNQGTAAVKKIEHTPNASCSLHIAELTRLVLGQSSVEDFLCSKRISGAALHLQLLNQLFPKKHNYLNESF